ncbi:IL20RA isoform 7, partial [Pan troglodytes]
MSYNGLHQRVFKELKLLTLCSISSPEKWKRNPEDLPVSMQQIYSNLKYNVSVLNTKSNRTWSQCVTNHTLVLTWLEPNTLYCVHVESFV